jgi:hypothetical protein
VLQLQRGFVPAAASRLGAHQHHRFGQPVAFHLPREAGYRSWLELNEGAVAAAVRPTQTERASYPRLDARGAAEPAAGISEERVEHHRGSRFDLCLER